MTAADDPIEADLYRYRDPKPRAVAEALGITPRHVRRLCAEHDLPMLNRGRPNGKRPTWRIPVETFRELRKLVGDADSSP